MDIGTAKPDSDEQSRISFHLLNLTTPDRQFTVAEWKSQAETAISNIIARGKRPIICGGTGLYIRALLDDWQLAETEADPAIRESLQLEAEQYGSQYLHQHLQKLDPVTAARLHPNDAMRIIRALEVYRITGQPISEYQQRDRLSQRQRTAVRFGMTMPRPELYQRIEQRVDAMIDLGFQEEVRALLAAGYGPDLGAMKSLGYKEMTQYLMGDLDLQTAIETMKQNTRRFAKRQQTWFRADKNITWFDVSGLNSATVAERLHAALNLE